VTRGGLVRVTAREAPTAESAADIATGRKSGGLHKGLKLVKMHGCGNDYVFVDTIGGPDLPEDVDVSALARHLADRHFGVGGDGLILIQKTPSGRLAMRMFNADGSEGEMCGNGMRCLALYCYKEGYARERRFEVETVAGVVVPEVIETGGTGRRGTVRVDLGPPREIRPGLELEVSGGPGAGNYRGIYVSMGNPHFVVLADDLTQVDLERAGPALERHPAFPERTNVEFVAVLGPRRLRMRVWERGSGVTLACATGAAASVVAAASAGRCRRQVVVAADGGELEVEWTAEGPVLMTGPAVEVFRTTYTGELPRMENGLPAPRGGTVRPS